MTSWTSNRVLDVLDHLGRVDRLVASARERMAANALFSAAGACGAAALAKRDAIRSFPDVIVGDPPDVPFVELYDLLYGLRKMLANACLRATGFTPPDGPNLQQLAANLAAARGALITLAARDWIDGCNTELGSVVSAIERLEQRLGSLDTSDLNRTTAMFAQIDAFLRCASDEVDLTDAFESLVMMDDDLVAAAKELLRRGANLDRVSVNRSLANVESVKVRLMERIVEQVRNSVGGGHPPGAEDLSPIPDDYASRRSQNTAIAALRIDPLDLALTDVAIAGWPNVGPHVSGILKTKVSLGEARRRDGGDPRDETPPVIHGEEIDGDCTPMVVRGIRDPRSCTPEQMAVLGRMQGEIVSLIWPGSRWLAEVRSAEAEMNRAVAYYRNYCIDLTFRQLQISERQQRNMARAYTQWFTALIREVPEDRIGNITLQRRWINPYREMMNAAQRVAHETGAKLFVIFIDHYLTEWRPTPSSACSRDYQQIGISWVDRQSPYILAHELVHAFGKSAPNTPGALTWDHNSNCQNALTTINRGQDSQTPVDLSNRYLDKLEYEEIAQNKGGNVLSAST